jgi:predicted permease
MSAFLLALAPVFLAILAGWAARRTRIVPEASWGGISRLAYMVLSPVFMFTEIARANLSFTDVSFVGAGCGAFAVVGALAFVMLPMSSHDTPAFASAQQGVVRWNTMLILAASLALLGPPGSALVALLMGPAIPVVNIITVSVHARWGHGQNPTAAGIARSILTNPLIIACALAIAVNLSGLKLPQVGNDLLSMIGRGALGISLMCVGAGLDFSSIAARPKLMTTAIVLKLVMAPLVFIGLGKLAGLDGLHLAALALCGAAPSPPAAYVLTREMGGDPRFMAGHITSTTLLSALAIPAALALAQMLS